MPSQQRAKSGVLLSMAVVCAMLPGCMAQQADLKRTERTLQDQLSKAGARQTNELSTLREEELPKLRGELEKANYKAQELQSKHDDLKHRLTQQEQQTRKLEQQLAKLETDGSTRHLWVQKSFETQEAKISSRLDDVSKAMETLKKDVIDVVQRTNEGLAKRVDAKLDEQRKEVTDNHNKLDQVSQKFAQFNQALMGFREALTGLHDRVEQGEQGHRNLTGRIDSDAKSTSTHADNTNRSLTSLAKALESVGQKVTSRLDEQDSRIDALSKTVEQISNKPIPRPQGVKPTQRLMPDSNDTLPDNGQASASPGAQEGAGGVTTIVPPQESALSESLQGSPDPADRVRYERLLGLFREGDLEGARQGFTSFLSEYPNSNLVPNARFWLGESYFGKKDFHKAIDAYDKVELEHPGSEKVPAAILKKGFAYLALKDKKRASSAFKQVVTLYPKSAEAGKASDKLAQLKEVR